MRRLLQKGFGDETRIYSLCRSQWWFVIFFWRAMNTPCTFVLISWNKSGNKKGKCSKMNHFPFFNFHNLRSCPFFKHSERTTCFPFVLSRCVAPSVEGNVINLTLRLCSFLTHSGPTKLKPFILSRHEVPSVEEPYLATNP